MTIHERAVVALARVRAAGVSASATDTGHQRRLRAAMTRDVVAMLGVPPERVLVTDDPARAYAGMPGQLITVQDPDDPDTVLRFIPEPGNLGTAGGAYLLLAACPGCSEPDAVREVAILSVADLADLARSSLDSPGSGQDPDPDHVPVEFFDDPEHAPDCPLR
jgi:hypothetical protein